ncbi:unnamed protein product [Mytilus coruscus]|uniref:Uncharacterized protein n=1 Tax=Mytilus coruscus TaxID=42192 RepID=A0A6J8D5I2_MYTCO|nr:unnamed protein product [Mytilus coruscus]
MQMKEIEKHQHTLEECPICTTKYSVFSSLHTCSKVENKAENLKSTCTNLVDTIQEEFSATPSINKVTKAVVQVINQVFASKFDVNFETAIVESFHLSPTETPESRKNTMEQTLNMSMQSINSALTDNDNDVRQFLTLEKSYKSHDREKILEKENHRLHAAGVLRVNTDEYYDKLTQPELDKCLINLQENHHCNSNTETKRNILKAIQRSRYIKVWHDHSDILSHTYINFMISYMYDSANFLTSKEYLERNPTIKDIDIQKIVERPQLYILGQSASTDQDQRTYIQTRMEDIVELSEGSKFQDVTFTDKIRIFSGDNPARQFEAGQQRGGAYSCLCGIPSKAHINLESCYKQKPQDLEDRRKLVTEGYLWKKIEGGNFNPFKNLKKEEIINELDHRKIEIMKEDKPSLQQKLTELLHGICRPPALMLNDPSISASENHIAHYEIMHCEPLHDITNVVQNVLSELPHHVEDPETKMALEKFTSKAIGDKNQLKGSDARCIAIKLEKLVHPLFLDGKISYDIVKMVSSMVEIIHIAYSPEEKRSPRQVLRLFNITFLFGVLAKSVIENDPKEVLW